MGLAHINTKERDKKERREKRAKKRKRIETQSMKPSTPFRAINALIGNEEQNGKQEKEKRRKQGAAPNQATLDIHITWKDNLNYLWKRNS